ncbi:hypothetical protein ABBQ38_002342 [Trebouxia sp. C0009 RCD-2024]
MKEYKSRQVVTAHFTVATPSWKKWHSIATTPTFPTYISPLPNSSPVAYWCYDLPTYALTPLSQQRHSTAQHIMAQHSTASATAAAAVTHKLWVKCVHDNIRRRNIALAPTSSQCRKPPQPTATHRMTL